MQTKLISCDKFHDKKLRAIVVECKVLLKSNAEESKLAVKQICGEIEERLRELVSANDLSTRHKTCNCYTMISNSKIRIGFHLFRR